MNTSSPKTPSPDDVGWVVVVPAKPLATAKSRLADAAGNRRPDLALAMLLDTVEATLRANHVVAVLVVTDDDLIAAAAADLGAIVVADLPGEGLNSAFRYGIEVATTRYPGTGVALLAGDLPALRSRGARGRPRCRRVVGRRGLRRRSRAGRHHNARVAFASPVAPCVRSGIVRTTSRPRCDRASSDEFGGLRCDVDDEAGLRAAVRLGVGTRTAATVSGPK